jgi:metal-responsive CopG/Arc/MetJ family transcriptional regulator
MEQSSGAIMKATKKKKIRPSQTGTPVYVRLQEEPLAALDDWRRHQADLPGRSEAIRRILEAFLKRSR